MEIAASPLVIDLAKARLVTVHREPIVPALADLSGAVREALENPYHFPALRRALTPDDQVAILVDEHLANLPQLLTPLLEHLAEAHIAPDAITLICTESSESRAWVESLPANFRHVKIEEHDPHNRKRLSYLAATKKGHRIYLNRTAVDADQLVVLSRRHYDPLLGIGGAEGAIFPALGDMEAQQAAYARFSMGAPGKTAWPAQQEAAEVAWLLGVPFFLQIIEGSGDDVAHVLGGVIDSSAEAQRLLDARWRIEVDEPADVVVAQMGGDPARHTFVEMASALACASRVVKPDGRIILISGGAPELGPGMSLLRKADTPSEALQLLQKEQAADFPAAFQWASAAERAKLYLVSGLHADIVEELFATPLGQPAQVARVVGTSSCLILPDAEKTLAVPK